MPEGREMSEVVIQEAADEAAWLDEEPPTVMIWDAPVYKTVEELLH